MMALQTQDSFGSRFERAVEQWPDNLAIAADGRELSYRETAELVRRVSRRLNMVAPQDREHPVAILMSHGADSVVALAGVFAAGRGYTPFDPNTPEPRLRRMLEHAGSTQILTDRAFANMAREIAGDNVEVLVIEAINAEPPAPRNIVQIDQNAIAALLFTSGSTGEPKAVANTQWRVMRGADHFRATTQLTPEDRVSLVTTYAYMPSTFSIFGPLVTGASVHPYDMRTGGIDGILPWLKSSQISVFSTVPTVFRRVAPQIANPDEISRLRHLQLAGEPLLESDVAKFRAHFPAGARLFNDMGATETGCLSRYHVDENAELQGGVAPVGHPYDDVEVILKDDAGREVGPGEPGELFVRGRHIAHGYWRRPELSEGRFFQDPQDPEVWIYRTGDLAMRREDGCLITMGRKDDQVKINGVRVEPAEVQAALTGIPGVREAVVTAPKDDNGERRLVAYVTNEPGATLNAGALRAAAANVLPMTMTPSAFIIMDELPTIVSGKVDRNALPDPDQAVRDASAATTVAGGPPEADEAERDVFVSGMVVAFQRTLKRDDIGPNDDFFLSGGDSLLAVDLMALVEENFNVKLPVSTMLEATTPAQLAARINTHVRADAPSGVLRLSGWNTAPGAMMPIFCIPGAGGHVLCYRHFIGALGVENPVYGLEYPGLKGEVEPLQTVEDIADHFAKHVMETAPTGPVAVVGHSVGGTVALEVSRRLNAAGRETPIIAFLDALTPESMRELTLKDKARLLLSYFLDPKQPDKLRTVYVRGTHVLTKSIDSLRGRLTPEPDWGREDPDGLLSAVRNANIRRVVAACQRAAANYTPTPLAQNVVQFRSSAPQAPIVSQLDCYTEWETITCGGIREVLVPGGHLDVLAPPAVEDVTAHLRDMLQEAAPAVHAAE